MKNKYSQLGVQLGVDLSVIGQFESHAGDVTRCLNETIYYWLHMEEDDDDDEEEEDAPSNKQTLFEALEAVDNIGLAEDLMKKYKGK